MKRVLALGAGLALVAAAGAVGAPSVGAAVTTTPVVPLVQTIELDVAPQSFENGPEVANVELYVVHGLNLDGQTAQSDGGTTVTICVAGIAPPPLTDVEFGEIASDVRVGAGQSIPLSVHPGSDCRAPAIIDQTVTIPEVAAVAVIATAAPGAAPSLLVVPLDVSPVTCLLGDDADPAGQDPLFDSRLGAVHAASAGEVSVTVDSDEPGDLLTFGGSVFQDFPSGSYDIGVTLGGTPIVGAEVAADSCSLTVVYVVGNISLGQPDPVVRPAFTG